VRQEKDGMPYSSERSDLVAKPQTPRRSPGLSFDSNIRPALRPVLNFAANERVARRTLALTGTLILACMMLQRFVIPYGGSQTSLVGPVGFAIAAVGLMSGALTFDRRRFLIYLLFGAAVLLGQGANALVSSPFNVPIGWMSVLQFLALNGFATLAFSHDIDEARFFRVINGCFAFIAVAGLIQFVLQFAGAPLFRFSGVLPGQILTERLTGGGYNNEISIPFGGGFKSNGFFLAEPSIFSQFMGVALAIETLYFRRPLFFGLFLAGLLASLSGTGWIVLGMFVLTLAFTMGRRGILLAGGITLALGLAMLILALSVPVVFDAFVGRYNEFFEVGSSAQIRFITPFWIGREIIDRAPWTLLLGVGSGVSEHVWHSYDGGINTPVKIALENGIPVLILYILLIGLNRHTSGQRRLLPPLLAMLALAGGYAQFPPVLFPILMIITVSSLTPSLILEGGASLRR
jgi:hypothetical protein